MLDDEDPAGEEGASSLEPAAVLSACASGGDLLVLRAPLRTARLFTEELHRAASLAGLPLELLLQLSPGLWLLRPAACEARRTFLHECIPALGGVRLCGSLIAAAADTDGLVKSATGALGSRRRWTLAYEVHYPSADHLVLPFVRLCSTPRLLIALHAALGADGYVPSAHADAARTNPAESDEVAEPLVLLHCKNGLLLLREHEMPRHPHAAATAARAPTERSAAAVAANLAALAMDSEPSAANMTAKAAAKVAAKAAAKAQARVEAARAEQVRASAEENWEQLDTTRLPWWLAPWAMRGFSFSSSLDSLVALAAVNLAACAYRAAAGAAAGWPAAGGDDRGSGLPLSGLRLYDPCCGSGTVLAAALAQGAAFVAGADMRAEFVDGARSNLLETGVLAGGATAELFTQDATLPLAETAPIRPADVELVVSNPPWGKKFGKAEDGGPIVRSVCTQFPHAATCWIVNRLTRQVIEDIHGVRVVSVIKLGAVEAVLVAPPASDRVNAA